MFHAKNYDNLYKDRQGEVDFLLKYLKGKTVLDIGGGTGIISEMLNKKGFECMNLEPQKEMCEISENRGVATSHGVIDNFEESERFKKFIGIYYDNAIMVFDVFNFLKEPEQAMSSISRLLKGRLIFTYWNYDVRVSGWDFNWKLMRLSHKKWIADKVIIDFWFPFWHEKHEMCVWSHNMIKRLLIQNKFKIVETIRGEYITKIIAEN